MLKSNAVIFGIEGQEVSSREKDFFKNVKPIGFILFARNVDNPEQVKALVGDLKSVVGWDCPVLIDQEGGRVSRLKPPHWRNSPPMSVFAQLAKTDIKKAEQASYLNSRIIGKELFDLGINVDCAPVCDLLFDDAHNIIGDRSFGSDVEIVTRLARKSAQGFLDSGILPVIKHIPGHGRALSDSHLELPVVDASPEELYESDFKVFKNLCNMPWAMTAHILYKAIDDKKPATLSQNLINIIRNEIGFKGFLISDDLSMEALQGSFASRTRESLNAGCDAVLHCNGKMDEMVEIADNVGELSGMAKKRLEDSMHLISSCSNDYSNEEEQYKELFAC
ncbi:MAG: beta-N-acetylhexosaminidase [Alphaproteobacteria bacterium CG11_big_fil_rev_8_21_14_0_20_39_49]|nr:MAG: beta-N-acetylhexosaminidase [Alphaproteobacteria bacterium CG11_big_fil_rev_8_21_14_0_20_39_49]